MWRCDHCGYSYYLVRKCLSCGRPLTYEPPLASRLLDLALRDPKVRGALVDVAMKFIKQIVR